jgi:hypothetical protein
VTDHTITLSETRRVILYPVFHDEYDAADLYAGQGLLAICLTYDEASAFRSRYGGDIEVWEAGLLKGNGGWAIESEDNAKHLTNMTEWEYALPDLGRQETE